MTVRDSDIFAGNADADLVVMSDHPFKLQANVEMTLIDGKVVFSK